MAFTFTEKAAAELKERIISRCREEFGDVHGMAEMFVGTIHAFCLELLKTEVPKYLKFPLCFGNPHSRAASALRSRTVDGR